MWRGVLPPFYVQPVKSVNGLPAQLHQQPGGGTYVDRVDACASTKQHLCDLSTPGVDGQVQWRQATGLCTRVHESGPAPLPWTGVARGAYTFRVDLRALEHEDLGETGVWYVAGIV